MWMVDPADRTRCWLCESMLRGARRLAGPVRSGDRQAKDETELEYWLTRMTKDQIRRVDMWRQQNPKAGPGTLVAKCLREMGR